jgi:ADP-ribose pyrophosphatase
MSDPTASRKVSERTIYTGRVVHLRVDTFETADGRRYDREIVVHRGAVVMVPVAEDGSVYLVRQLRVPAGRTLLELPAGTLEPGEDPLVCARRELQEEIGFQAGQIERLGGFFSAPGFCTEYLHIFVARDLAPSQLDGDEDETIEVVKLSPAAVRAAARRGEIEDAKTLAALFLYELANRP